MSGDGRVQPGIGNPIEPMASNWLAALRSFSVQSTTRKLAINVSVHNPVQRFLYQQNGLKPCLQCQSFHCSTLLHATPTDAGEATAPVNPALFTPVIAWTAVCRAGAFRARPFLCHEGFRVGQPPCCEFPHSFTDRARAVAELLRLVHTATPDTTRTGLFCRVWRGCVN